MSAEVVNPAKGTTLSYSPGTGTPTYTVIAQIVSIDKVERKVGTRDTKSLGSTADTYAPTIVKNGTVAGQLLYDPKGASQALLEGISQSPPAVNPLWKVTYNDATNGPTYHAFSGILTEFSSTGIEVEANLLADFEIQISGLVTST